MKPHTFQQTSAVSYRTLIGLFFAILALSGCGLALDSNDKLDRGEAALAEGNFRAAIIDAKGVLLKEPDNMRGRLLLGRAALKSTDGPAAEKELRRAIELGADKTLVAVELAQALLQQRKYQQVLDEIPLDGLASPDDEASVRVAHGDALLGLKQPEAARMMYTSVLDIRPEDRNARLGIVSSFIADGNPVQARSNLDLILDSNSDDPEVWLFAGSFSARNRDFDSAVPSFTRALKLAESRQDAKEQDDMLDTVRLKALTGLADSLLEKRDVDSARKHVKRLVSLAPEYWPAKLLVARIAYLDRDWKTAQQELQQVLQVAPNYQPAQVMLGAVHLQGGNLAQAEMYLSAAVAAKPDDVKARQFLAECRLQMQRNEDARQALEPILGAAHPDPVSLQLAARASLGSRNVDEALEFLRRNIAEDPDNPNLRFQLALTLLQVGRPDAARSVLDEMDVSGSPENAYRRDALAVLTSIRDGNEAEALKNAEKLVEKYDDRAAAYSLLGAVQFSSGAIGQAKNSFAQSTELDPDNMLALRSLAEIDEFDGNTESAKVRYLDFLEDQPDAAWAMAALGRIAFSEQDFETASAYLHRAHRAMPENVIYRLNLARAEYQNGNMDSAASLLEDEIEATFNHVPSGILLAMIKVQDGDAAKALDIAAKLQERHSSEAAPHAFEGDIHLETGDLIRADRAYDKALSMDTTKRYALRSYQIKRRLGIANSERPLLDYLEARPLDYEVRAVLAESYMQTGNVSKSIRTYEGLASEQPGNAVVLNNLAWAYYLADDPRAIETARKASAVMPENGAIVDTLGWILVENDELVEGEALLRKAVEMEQGRADIQYHHAVALARLERTEEARVKLEQILSDDLQFSGRSDAEKLLAEL